MELNLAQRAQRAGEIDELGGLSSEPCTLDRLKSAAGMDVFDVSTEDGNNPVGQVGTPWRVPKISLIP